MLPLKKRKVILPNIKRNTIPLNRNTILSGRKIALRNVIACLLIVLSLSLTACSYNSGPQPESFYEKEPDIEAPAKPYTEDGLVDALTQSMERNEILQEKIDTLNPYL